MANKFNFGKLSHKLERVIFAGEVVKKWGENKIAGAYFDKALTYTYGFGEIVEIVGDLRTNYKVKPVDATTTANSTLGIILRELTGAASINDVTVENGIPSVPLNVLPLTKVNLSSFGVPVVEGTTKVAVGGQVYVGTGASGTIQGSAYSTNVTGTIIATGVAFNSLVTKPTLDAGLTASINVKL